jgi:hypothetical protein
MYTKSHLPTWREHASGKCKLMFSSETIPNFRTTIPCIACIWASKWVFAWNHLHRSVRIVRARTLPCNPRTDRALGPCLSPHYDMLNADSTNFISYVDLRKYLLTLENQLIRLIFVHQILQGFTNEKKKTKHTKYLYGVIFEHLSIGEYRNRVWHDFL